MKKQAAVAMMAFLLFGTSAFADILAQITKLKGNGAFPTELVTVHFVRHCTESFSGAWMKQASETKVGIAVTLVQVTSQCNFHETQWITESVVLPIPAQFPTRYYRLKSLEKSINMSGVSIDNFN